MLNKSIAASTSSQVSHSLAWSDFPMFLSSLKNIPPKPVAKVQFSNNYIFLLWVWGLF